MSYVRNGIYAFSLHKIISDKGWRIAHRASPNLPPWNPARSRGDIVLWQAVKEHRPERAPGHPGSHQRPACGPGRRTGPNTHNRTISHHRERAIRERFFSTPPSPPNPPGRSYSGDLAEVKRPENRRGGQASPRRSHSTASRTSAAGASGRRECSRSQIPSIAQTSPAPLRSRAVWLRTGEAAAFRGSCRFGLGHARRPKTRAETRKPAAPPKWFST